MKLLFTITRIIIGLVFVMSGVLKGIDPLGTAYKFEDYFVLVFQMPSLTALSLPLSLFLSALEFTVGITLIFNLVPKFTFWSSLGLMTFFTPLTLYLAIANPVSDCGCFGDAIKLTNWQTFGKNIIFIMFLLPYWFLYKKYTARIPLKTQKIIKTTALLLLLSFEFYNYSYLPVVDFRPYKEGVNIYENMQIPPDAPKDIYKTILVYKNIETGETKEFDEDNFPWNDSTWQWQETKTTLIKKGYVPPIHDFSIKTLDDIDITDSVLNLPKTLLIISYNLSKANIRGVKKIKEFYPLLTEDLPGLQIFWLTSSSKEIINQTKTKFDLDLNFYHTDETTLKTIIRSNPGLVFLKKGTIVKKLNFHSLNKTSIKKLHKIMEN